MSFCTSNITNVFLRTFCSFVQHNHDGALRNRAKHACLHQGFVANVIGPPFSEQTFCKVVTNCVAFCYLHQGFAESGLLNILQSKMLQIQCLRQLPEAIFTKRFYKNV